LHARVAAAVGKELRTRLFEVRTEGGGGLAPLLSRSLADAEELQTVGVQLLDEAALGTFRLLAPLVPLAAIDAWSLVVIAAVAVAGSSLALLARLIGRAGRDQQDALEAMSYEIVDAAHSNDSAQGKLSVALEVVAATHRRVGWLRSASLYGSSAIGALGSVAIVLAVGLHQHHNAGVLTAVFLLATRALSGLESLLDLGFDLALLRGPFDRCYEALAGHGAKLVAPRAD
jgi:hypothetical protein